MSRRPTSVSALGTALLLAFWFQRTSRQTCTQVDATFSNFSDLGTNILVCSDSNCKFGNASVYERTLLARVESKCANWSFQSLYIYWQARFSVQNEVKHYNGFQTSALEHHLSPNRGANLVVQCQCFGLFHFNRASSKPKRLRRIDPGGSQGTQGISFAQLDFTAVRFLPSVFPYMHFRSGGLPKTPPKRHMPRRLHYTGYSHLQHFLGHSFRA